jgi:serine phosphatase RsbU (regulator of sigma subunit)/Tfp pilus assembly protein PilF
VKGFPFIRLFIVGLLLCSGAASAQSVSKRDSLFSKLHASKNDSEKVKLLNLLSSELWNENKSKAVTYSREALQLSRKIGYKKGEAASYRYIGDYYSENSDYPEALKNYFLALKIREDLRDSSQMLMINNLIGIAYSYQGKHYEGRKHFMTALKIAEAIKQKKDIASCSNNIGVASKNLGKYEEAAEYYEKARIAFEAQGRKDGIAASYSNIGAMKVNLGNYAEALELFIKARKIFLELKDQKGIAGTHTNMADLYAAQGQYALAIENYKQGIAIAREAGNKVNIRNAYDGLYKVYEKQGNYAEAFRIFKAYTALRDSLVNEEGNNKIKDIENKYENEKREREIEMLKQREQIQKLELSRQEVQLQKNRAILIAGSGGTLLILGLLFVLYNRYQIKQRANRELEEKRREIQDSINYAKQIQRAILPNPEEILSTLECFGLYKPKDVVSGDFYWFAKQNGKVLIAAADCTGHGVPGAFMSMIGIDKLNNAVQEKQLYKPGDILSSLNKGIKQSLRQDEQDSVSRDGMDIALCSFDFKQGRLEYAGANRPLLLIRNGEMIEVKPTKAAIGGWTENVRVFENNELHLEKGDTIYLFTDGYADQIGGEKGKKIMTRKFKEILLNIQHLTMEAQEKELERVFNEWKGNHEQVDDVLVIGIRV